MMRFGQRQLKKISSLFLALMLLLGNALPASAGLFSGPKIPSASSVFSDMEKRYHLDTESLQTQGEGMNVASNKQPTPQLTLFFSPSDPKVGEKVSAKAFPMYFSNKENQLYYTWYLKHAGCDLTNSPSQATQDLCDRDFDDKITIEDWKIEAMSILVNNGFEYQDVNYSAVSDTDDDGYKARYGGDNKVGVPDHCYYNDATSGINYELLNADVDDADELSFDCPAGETPICMEGEGELDSCVIDPLNPSTCFDFSDTGICHPSGSPICNNTGTVLCSVGAPRCVADPVNSTSCGTELLTCTGGEAQDTACRHLFPEAPGLETGDGSFGKDEEEFWRTNPEDPDTADNGNKDEANVTGLGQANFTWNYITGDKVGVVVEGTSMIATKYDDASAMVMWAFSKNDCPISLANGTGAITKKIKGYDVDIPTVQIDLNKCIERNLVDPTEGGQATNLEVSVSATPESPINDESTDATGDMLTAQASLSNASNNLSNILFDWEVEISSTPRFPGTNITKDLQKYELLGNNKGTALDTLRLKLDMQKSGAQTYGGQPLSSYLTGGVGYLRLTAKASESFKSGTVRKGKSDIVVKFTSSGKKISVYKVIGLPGSDASTTRVKLDESTKICEGNPADPNNKDNLDRSTCRVITNEIIGLKVDPTGLSNFNWTINGATLNCSSSTVSNDCSAGEQNHVNFFPVTGKVGDTYTVTVSATDLSSTAKTDQVVTLTRTFHVVDPELTIKSLNTSAWAKLLGQYQDISGQSCSGGICPEYSDTVFEGFAGESLAFTGEFMPNFLASRATRQWTVDGAYIAESGNGIAFSALKTAPDVYNIGLSASVVQPVEIRRALSDIWGVSQLDSPEIHFATSAQVELREPGFAQGTLQGSKKYLAAIASYIPASVMFTFRIALSIMLILFTAHVLFVLLPDHSRVVRTPHDR